MVRFEGRGGSLGGTPPHPGTGNFVGPRAGIRLGALRRKSPTPSERGGYLGSAEEVENEGHRSGVSV